MNTCLDCAGLMGCRLLSDTHGRFVPERVITEENPSECSSWRPVGHRQRDVRQTLYGIQDVNSLRVLHQLPAMVMDQLVEQESEDGMTQEMPDFAGMIADDMTSTEREEQLRFETNPDGSFVEDEGIRRPRPSYQLRKFACDPEGHVQLDHSVGMFWTTDKVIQHIVASEVEQGLITKAKRAKKANGAKPKTAAKAAPKTETSDMAAGRRVMINRGGGGGGSSEEKVKRPPAKRGSKAAPKTKEPEDDGNGAAPAGDIDLSAVVGELQAVFGEALERLEKKVDDLAARVDEIGTLDTFEGDKKVKKAISIGHLLETLTIFHDLACQTEGQFAFEDDKGKRQLLPEMFRNPDLLRGYVTGAETPPDPEA